MEDYIDQYLEEARDQETVDRRNGYCGRHLLTELGDVFMTIPRTRLTSAARVLDHYGRRSPEVDRAILSCFVLGCSTRKVAKVLAPMLDERVSAMTVSRIAKTLDDAVGAFHKDRGRRGQTTGAHGPWHTARRQEGGNRLAALRL